MKTLRIAIIGAGELGCQTAHLALRNGYTIAGFFDDVCQDPEVMHLPLLGKIADIDATAASFDALVIAIGYNHFAFRKHLYDTLSPRYPFATIIDASAHIDPTATISPGCVIYPNVTIDKDVTLLPNCLVNLSVTISHNSLVGPHCYIAPAVTIAGYAKVGACCFLGVRSTIIDHVSITDNLTIGANALIIKDIDESNRGGYLLAAPRADFASAHRRLLWRDGHDRPLCHRGLVA